MVKKPETKNNHNDSKKIEIEIENEVQNEDQPKRKSISQNK